MLSSEALFTTKNVMKMFSFTRLLTPLCLIASLYSANLTFFLARQTRNDSKGRFPLSCYFYVLQVNFTGVNSIELIHGRSRENVKFELRSTLFKRSCVTAVQFILFNFANYSSSVAMELEVSKEITCK